MSADFTVSIQVDKSPEEAYSAINNVRGWWSEQIDGPTDKLNEAYLYHFKDVHIVKMKITELIPGKKVTWKVLENHFSFTKNPNEWKDTSIHFDIEQKGGKTEICFTHVGLTSADECFNVCNEAWTNYITNSLFNLITKGKGQPNPKDGEGYNALLAEKWNIK